MSLKRKGRNKMSLTEFQRLDVEKAMLNKLLANLQASLRLKKQGEKNSGKKINKASDALKQRRN